MRKLSSWSWLWGIVLCVGMALLLGVCSPLSARAAGTDGMITIELTDSYGDGWSDNAIEV
jgi:hypothetical protein